MPKRILVIGILFCLGGVLAIWDIITDLFQSSISLNFAVFLLPVGMGLLKGKPSSQKWARFWVILGYIFCVFMTSFVIVFPESASVRLAEHEIRGPEALPYALSLIALLAISLVVIHKLLYSEKALAYFNRSYK